MSRRPGYAKAMSRHFAFMHVPKTAGIAFALAIRAATAAPGDVFGFDRHQFGSYDAFDELDEAQRSLIRLQASDWPQGIGFVRGHVTLGTLRAAYPRHELLTVLREPWSRLISLWLFWRGQSEAEMQGWGGWGERVGAARGSLGRFLANPLLATQTDNVLVRLLLAPHPLVPPEGFIPSSADRLLLPAARAALARFDFVGWSRIGRSAQNLANSWVGPRRSADTTSPPWRRPRCDRLSMRR